MKVNCSLLYLLAISLCLCNCSANKTELKSYAVVIPPLFTDNGKTIDSVQKAYDCETIDFENWGDKTAKDSFLTIRLINSTKVPSLANMDRHVNELETIAFSIKKALANPQAYKSFYIIFIKKEFVNGEEIQAHAAGMEVASAAL
jgi:hypothetical protein